MAYKTKINYANRKNYGTYRATSKIKYIVWHYTASDGASDENSGNYFKNNVTKTSAHYFVDDDSVTISVPDSYVAYSVGGSRYSDYKKTGGARLYKVATNANTLNIELCDVVKNGKHDVTEKTLENAIELTRSLMKKYNISISRVIRHFDVTGKYCPAYFMDEAKWRAVKERIAGAASVKGFTYQGLDYSAVFNSAYYSNRYPDLKCVYGTNATELFNHFCAFGMKEGRQGIEAFNVQAYKERYADLRGVFGDNLPEYYRHYIMFGKGEKRTAV